MSWASSSSRSIFFVVAFFAMGLLGASSTWAENKKKTDVVGMQNHQESNFPNGETVRIGVSHNPPLASQGKGGAPQGFVIDIIRHVAKAERWNLVYIERSWPELLRMLEAGQIDILGGIAYTPSRAKKYSFSQEAAANNWAVVYRNKNIQINSIQDLNGKRLALLPGAIHTIALRKLAKSFDISFDEIAAKDYAQTLKLVDSGEADAGVVARTFHILHGAGYASLATDVRFNPIEIRFAAPKEAGNVHLSAFDAYLSTQKNDPSSQYNQSLAFWFTGQIKEVIPTWLIGWLGGISALLCAAWFGVVYLRREVGARTLELKESEQRFRDFAQIASDWMWETDENHRFSYVPDHYEEATGRKPESVIGKTRWEVFDHDPEDENWCQHRADVEAHRPFKGFQYSVRDRDDRVLYWSLNGVPMFDVTGTFKGYRGTGTDLTAETEARLSAKMAQEKLFRAQKIETVGTLARGIAHDINNTLTPIINYADLILDAKVGEKKVKAWAAKILMSAQRAAELIQQIQTFSKQTNQNAQIIVLPPLIKETLRLIRSTTPKTIEFVTEITQQCPHVLIDPTQAHQVMMNLCINAVQAMEEGGGILTVSLTPVQVNHEMASMSSNLNMGEYLRLSVSDTGHGIDRETKKRIFDPFFTTKELSKGTGLGLSTVHGIVMAHNGDVTVYSEPGGGATFHVYLPAQQGTESTKVSTEAPAQGGHERILVVDDEEENTASIGEVLSLLGYDTQLFNDSEKALAVFASSPNAFDLVITDHMMPKMTGKMLAQKLIGIRSDLPVIMITGDGETETAKTIEGAGVRDVLLKPLTKGKLDQAIRSALSEETDLSE